eukprot:gene32086-32790_t
MTAKSPHIAPATAALARAFADRIPELIRATGPVSYDYQFGAGTGLLARLVAASWQTPATLFAAASTTFATEGDDLLGLELGFEGPNFYAFKDNLVALAPDLIARGVIGFEELQGLAARAGKA